MENTRAKIIVDEMTRAGLSFFVSVPCKLLAGIISVLEKSEGIIYLPATREEEGVGLCVGAYLGGKMPCIVMQNSGLGNSINALASLVALYRIPLVMLISHRGTPGEKIGAQFPMGALTSPILQLLNIPQFVFSDIDQMQAELNGIVKYTRVIEHPVAILLDFKFWRSASETL